MRTLKGPALFLSQFAGDEPPFDTLPGIARWAAGHGLAGVQIPSWDRRLFGLALAAESDGYCDEVRGALAWPCFHPYPQRPAELVEQAFD